MKSEPKSSPTKSPKPEVKSESDSGVKPEVKSEQKPGGDATSSNEESDAKRSELEEGEISRDDLEAYRRGHLRYSQDDRVNTVLKQLYAGTDGSVPVGVNLSFSWYLLLHLKSRFNIYN